MIKELLIKLILIYQKVFSPIIVNVFGIRCRFYPSCSEYTLCAIKRFGVINGLILGVIRFFKCNPLFDGGYDPVPMEFSFRKQILLKEVFLKWKKE